VSRYGEGYILGGLHDVDEARQQQQTEMTAHANEIKTTITAAATEQEQQERKALQEVCFTSPSSSN
jgi:hypothetical protein